MNNKKKNIITKFIIKRKWILFRKKYNSDYILQVDNYISQYLLHSEKNQNLPFLYSEERKRFLEEHFNNKLKKWNQLLLKLVREHIKQQEITDPYHNITDELSFIFCSPESSLVCKQIEDQIKQQEITDPFLSEELFLFYKQIKDSTSIECYRRDNPIISYDKGYYKLIKYYRRHGIQVGSLECLSVKLPPSESKIYDMLDSILRDKEKEFTELLLSILIKKGLKNSEVYKSINMSRKVFSAIYNGQRPSRDSAIMLAFGLKLNLQETQDFLNSAGYSLGFSNRRDLVLRYCIENDIDPISADIILDHYGEPVLFSIR